LISTGFFKPAAVREEQAKRAAAAPDGLRCAN
jgi:hypothetical protein